MRNMFFIVKKKILLTVVALVLVVALVAGAVAVRQTSSPKPQYTIVIDAGHGGLDVK